MADLLTDVKAVLTTTPLRWHNIIQNFPEDLLHRQPLPGEWSALECLHHLLDVDRSVFPFRIKALLAGEDFPGFVPAKDGTPLADKTPLAIAEEFAAIRAENLKLLDTVTPSDFGRQARHAQLGMVTMENLLYEWGGHDLMHMVQAEQALMQPFITGSGAWLPYFATHVADTSKINKMA